jgi:hypothetical protein
VVRGFDDEALDPAATELDRRCKADRAAARYQHLRMPRQVVDHRVHLGSPARRIGSACSDATSEREIIHRS